MDNSEDQLIYGFYIDLYAKMGKNCKQTKNGENEVRVIANTTILKMAA